MQLVNFISGLYQISFISFQNIFANWFECLHDIDNVFALN